MRISRTSIAESNLRLLNDDDGHRHVGYWVRLAQREGVPFGRIVELSGLTVETVSAVLEEP